MESLICVVANRLSYLSWLVYDETQISTRAFSHFATACTASVGNKEMYLGAACDVGRRVRTRGSEEEGGVFPRWPFRCRGRRLRRGYNRGHGAKDREVRKKNPEERSLPHHERSGGGRGGEGR